jgi:hypothetical protein
MRTKKLQKLDIEKWATQVLLHANAIEPCSGCGFKKLRFDHAAMDYAHELAKRQKLPGLSTLKCIEAVDTVLDGLGDECPACA